MVDAAQPAFGVEHTWRTLSTLPHASLRRRDRKIGRAVSPLLPFRRSVGVKWLGDGVGVVVYLDPCY